MYATDESFAYSAMKDDDAKSINDTSSKRRSTLSAWAQSMVGGRVGGPTPHRGSLGNGVGAQWAPGVGSRTVDLGPG